MSQSQQANAQRARAHCEALTPTAGVAGVDIGAARGNGRRLADLSQRTIVDVYLTVLADDVVSGTALRLACPAPLPTVPTPDNAFGNSARRPVDAFEYAVGLTLSGHIDQPTVGRRAVDRLAGVVELSGNPAAVKHPSEVWHARSFRPRKSAVANQFFVVVGAIDDGAVRLLKAASHESRFAAMMLDAAADTIGRLPTQYLQSLDLSRCTSLTKLGDSFLKDCESLRTLRLPASVRSLGDEFCCASGLERLDLSHCASLAQLGEYFLHECESLRALTLPPSVSSIGAFFCTSTDLQALDISHCTSLTELGDMFLACCPLRALTLPASVTSVGGVFCSQTKLTALDLSPCTSLTQVGGSFLLGCKSLRTLTLPTSVASISDDFCYKAGIEVLDLSHCTSLTRIGDSFLGRCASLRSLTLPPSLSTGDGFCADSGLDGIDVADCIAASP